MDYELSESNDVVVFKPLVRIVDQSNASTYLAPMADSIRNGRRIALDLSAVSFLNSAGLGAIVTAIRDLRQAGGKLRVCAPQPTVKALFVMVRLENIAAVAVDVASAVAALAGSHGR